MLRLFILNLRFTGSLQLKYVFIDSRNRLDFYKNYFKKSIVVHFGHYLYMYGKHIYTSNGEFDDRRRLLQLGQLTY